MRLEELQRYGVCEVFTGRRTALLLSRLILVALWGRGGWSLVALMRLRDYFRINGYRHVANLLGRRMERRFGCYISPTAHFGLGIKFPHPIGIVIGDGVVVGQRCTIFQNVTLGAARRGEGALNCYPQIGDDANVFAGAVVVGKLMIGDHATIGANAVVTKDVPPGTTAVGIPARILEDRRTAEHDCHCAD